MRTDVLYKVEAAGSTTEKVALLKTVADDALTVELLKLALDPYTTFGITMNRETMLRLSQRHLSDDFPVSGNVDLDNAVAFSKYMAAPIVTRRWWDAFILVLTTLSKRGLTGSRAESAVNDVIAAAPSLATADWAWRVLNKDLRCGVSVTLALKAFPGLVKPFKIAQAHPYKDQDIDYAGYMDPKLDGERCLVVRGRALSRYGLDLPGASNALKDLGNFSEEWVFDGELYKHGKPLNEIHSLASVEAPNDLDYVVFDCFSIRQWDAQNTFPLYARRDNLAEFEAIAGTESWVHTRIVETFYCESMSLSSAIEWRDFFRKQGYEGAMWKRADAPYSFTRNNDIIKFKMFETVDGKIVDMYEGEGKHEGRLGGLVIELPSGVQTKLGGGFSDAQRDEFWALGASMFGQYVEGTAQEGKTKNGKLRHGNFVRMRPDKE